MGIVACWKPQDPRSHTVKELCLAALGVGLGFVYKGHRAQPARESRSARDDEPTAHQGNFEGRVAKMVREDEPTTPRDPSVWELATRDDEPVEARSSVRENEPTERKIAREHEPATSRWAGENEPAPRVKPEDPCRMPFYHCPTG